MGLAQDCGLDKLDIAAGIDSERWAENEFGDSPLGDKRLSGRLVEVAAEKAEHPGLAYSGVAGGDWPKVKGYYRMIDKSDNNNCSSVDLLIRAQYNRRITGEHKLFEASRQSPVQARINIQVPRQSARPKKSKQKARPERPMRTAQVCVRFKKIEITPPSYYKHKRS